ncbi:MAG: hypothetical protein MUC65_08135 [Pontiellaceae bacterium]|jgi:hypothetical protein|nr:hypothetical protein [Pontiellaceae bacterium]
MNIKRQKCIITVVVSGIVLLGTGCASIVSKSSYPIKIYSNPDGATVTIKNKFGVELQKGVTPMVATLSSKAGFFKPAEYDFVFEKAGYYQVNTSIKAQINGWYFGNFLLSSFGLIGFVIIDPATGAMWRINDKATFGNLSPDLNASMRPVEPHSLAMSSLTTSQVITTNDLSVMKHFTINDFRIVEYNFDAKTGAGNLTVDIGKGGFQARLWVVKNIGMICSSKNVAIDAGDEKFSGAKYTVLDESIKDGLLKILFKAVY